MHGVDHDASRIDLVEQRPVVREGLALMALSNHLGLSGIGVGHADEIDFRQTSENSRMRLTEMPNTNDRHP
jgi:hypothetical protein